MLHLISFCPIPFTIRISKWKSSENYLNFSTRPLQFWFLQDLATLVHDQGEVIDSIEANVESTHVRVQEGTEQLRQAENYKVRWRIFYSK